MSAEPVSHALASMLSTCATVRAWAEQDEGPYHRDARPLRRDIVEDRDGVALHLGVRLAVDDTTPVRDATVEIWQCDALGRYSGFPSPNDATTDEILPAGGDRAVLDIVPDGAGYRAAICLVLPSSRARSWAALSPLPTPPWDGDPDHNRDDERMRFHG